MEAVKELSDLVGNSDEWFNSFWSLVMEMRIFMRSCSTI